MDLGAIWSATAERWGKPQSSYPRGDCPGPLPHHVYIVRCADDTLYTGYTTDVSRRIDEHNAGDGSKYTRGRAPVELVHTEEYPSRSAAQAREAEIKAMRREAKLELAASMSPTNG